MSPGDGSARGEELDYVHADGGATEEALAVEAPDASDGGKG